MAATPGSNPGNYPPAESPNNAIDNNATTKYISYGSCADSEYNYICGLNTGFYLTLRRGASVAVGFQICTANDFSTRDPLTVTLEGSNQPDTNLTLGTSWTLIYSGSSGLETYLNRSMWGPGRYFSNSIQYTSYRFLVTSKRSAVNSVQYSDVQFFGF